MNKNIDFSMNKIVTSINDRKDWLSDQIWIIPICFGLSCTWTVLSIVSLILRGFDGLRSEWLISIGADLFCMAVCTMLCFSATLNRKTRNADTHVFTTLLTTTSFSLFLDEIIWLVQGYPEFNFINMTANVLYFMMGAVLIYLFWQYIRRALRFNDRPMKLADRFVSMMLYPSILLCLVNFVYPLFFRITEDGFYERADQWDVSQIYLAIAVTVLIIGLAFAKTSKKNRFVSISFIAIPLASQIATANFYGLSIQYPATTVSIVLIYGVLFAERERTLASTEMELGVATKIQAEMLPNTFPFMPERTEFDLYASMTPAKEVGGDFYDFFMIDDDHIALEIADVSGKGIPAALFMMASKIMIKNAVMTGKGPAEVLADVNNRICENNKQEMFVTVWLGILDLRDGTLVTANAGHEYPIIKPPDGDFELIRTKHSFVVGGMEGIRYKQTEMKLEPGSKIFVYTDGVPEAENESEEQYGYDRFLSVLNKSKDETPEKLLERVGRDVRKFTEDQPQFDDLTMLCIHYRGKEK